MEQQSELDRINRRRFLGHSGIALLGTSLSGVLCNVPSEKKKDTNKPEQIKGESFQANGWESMFEEAVKYRKLDAHNHVAFAGLSAGDVNESCERLGITKAACSFPGGKTPQEIRDNNSSVLQAMKAFPDRILGQCFVNPTFRKETLEEIDRCVDQGMVMLGELYTDVKVNDPLFYPVIEKCIDLKIPMMWHGVNLLGNWRKGYGLASPPNSSLPGDFVDIAKRYPEAMIICGHIGGGGNWEYNCRILRDAPTIYLDTSGSVTDEGMIDMAVEYLGVDRLLFATDINYETGVGKIMWANLTESDRKKIFFDNFNNLLKKRGNHVN